MFTIKNETASLGVDHALARNVSEDVSTVSCRSCETTLEAIKERGITETSNQYQKRLNALETRVDSLKAAHIGESEEQPALKHKIRAEM